MAGCVERGAERDVVTDREVWEEGRLLRGVGDLAAVGMFAGQIYGLLAGWIASEDLRLRAGKKTAESAQEGALAAARRAEQDRPRVLERGAYGELQSAERAPYLDVMVIGARPAV